MGNQDILLHMQEDLKRALTKSASTRRWGMLIDTRACVGCSACTVGCMAENVLPKGTLYRPMFEMESGKYPDVKRLFVSRPCMQCVNPPCVSVCPQDATHRATEGVEAGVVVIDYDKCIGCGTCVEACPYKARTVDGGTYYTEDTPELQHYETRKFNEYSSVWTRDKDGAPVEKARKCHFCVHRLREGMLPLCVTTCISRSLYFGDMNDKDSLISAKIKENKIVTAQSVPDATHNTGKIIFGESVTEPVVFYIV